MKSYSQSLGGSYSDTNFITGVTTTVLTTKYEHNLIVTSAPKGDFKNPTAHSYSTLTVNRLKGKKTTIRDSDNLLQRQLNGDLGITPVSLSENLTAQAYTRALGKLYDKWRGELDLAVDIAEAHQAKAMLGKYLSGVSSFRGVMTKIGHAAAALRRARRDPTKIVANMWLEWTYGWKPLATSIYGCFDEMYRVRPYRVRAKARAYKYRQVGVATGFPGLSDKCTVTNSSRCLIDVYFRPPSSVLSTLSGYTSLNPIGIAWELVPYSFVVDWFIDIGGYVRNLESCYLSRSSFVKGYVTTTFRNETHVSRRGISVDTGANLRTVWDAEGLTIDGMKDRSILTSSPLPRPPSPKVDLGSYRMLSAAALLRQLIKH